jgi:peptidylprolyl isomerase
MRIARSRRVLNHRPQCTGHFPRARDARRLTITLCVTASSSEVFVRRVFVLLILSLAIVASTSVAASAATKTTTTLPTATGSFGHAPTITFPSTGLPKALESKVLQKGSGQNVVKGDLLVANYYGQIWKGNTFASSYSEGETAAFPIGVGEVIPAWDKTLVGVPVGSRVLIASPPADAYGTAGNSGAGIKPNTTIVFVIDIVAVYSKSIGTKASADVVKTTASGITVTGPVGSAPTVKIPKNLAKPKTTTFTVLDRGHGVKAKAGMVILQYSVYDWTGTVIQSTWKSGTPDGEYIGNPQSKTAFDSLVGLPFGSRVLITLPSTSSGGPYALVIELAGEAPSGSSK